MHTAHASKYSTSEWRCRTFKCSSTMCAAQILLMSCVLHCHDSAHALNTMWS